MTAVATRCPDCGGVPCPTCETGCVDAPVEEPTGWTFADVEYAIALRQAAVRLKEQARYLELIPVRREAAADLFRRAHAAWLEAEELLTRCGLR